MTTTEIKQELQARLSENPLQDADDLMEFVQYASRLAALGDETAFRKLPDIFGGSAFAGQVPDMLKLRCEQGVWEADEYSGEELAFSLIDAQDFFCFERRMGDSFPGPAPFFEAWWDACEDAELDEETAEMLRDFLDVYPIPREELLPVVGTPITETEYELLETIYADVELPVIEMFWRPNASTTQTAAAWRNPTKTVRPTLLLSCDDAEPSNTLKKAIESTENTVNVDSGVLKLGRRLNDAWELQVFAESSAPSISVTRMRIGAIPVFQDAETPTCWTVDLSRFDSSKRKQLLEEPLTIQLANGISVQCTMQF